MALGKRPVELFTLLCETCAAKLKVTRPNAVGQVLACPKCNNMLKVVPPVGWTPPPELKDSLSVEDIAKLESFASLGASSESFEDIEDILSKPVLHRSPVGMPERKKKARKLPVPSPEIAEPAAADPILPTGDWTSQESQARRKRLLIGGGILGALLILGSLATAIVVNRGADSVTNNDTPVADVEPDDPGAEVAPDKNTVESETPSEPGTADTETPSDLPDEANPDAPPEIPMDDVPEIPDPTVNEPVVPDAPPEIPDTDSKTTIPNNPLAGLLDGNAMTPKADDLINRDVFGSPLEDNTKLGSLSALLNQSNTSIRKIQNLAESIRDEETVGISKYYIEKPNKAEIDTSKLDAPCGGIIYEDISVLAMLREVTAITGVPFAFDATACNAAAFDFKSKVKIRMETKADEKVTFESAVNFALNELSLVGVEEQKGCVTVRTSGSATPVTIDYPIPAFAKDREDEMVTFIKGMIASNTWDEESTGSIAREGDVLKIHHSPAVQLQIKAFFDKLSKVFHFPGSPSELVQQQLISTRWSSAATSLAKPSGLARTLPITLEEYCSALERSSGVTLLIDWPSLMQQGWHPRTKVPGNIQEKTVLETTKELSRAMNATFRAIDPETVELTTFESATAQTELEVFYYGDLIEGRFTQEQLVTLIKRTLSREFNTNPDIRMDFVPHLNCIVSVAPQALQRQLELVMDTLRGL